MVSHLLFIFYLIWHLTSSQEQDIYHVITGESDTPHKKSLDPVNYVGVYDEKPLLIPNKYEIELMTSDSGKRFTCVIPKDNTFVTRSEPEDEVETEVDHVIEDDEEPPKTTEELLQEVDTLDNRDRYLQELSKNRHPCYYSREGYWNYELCLYGKITQYHGTKKKRNPNIKLGDFATYVDVSKILMNDKHYALHYLIDIYGLALFENTEKNFVHLLYNDGEAKRESLVTIQCSKAYSKRSKDRIITIDEPRVHRYHFTVIYKAVCDYEQWLRLEYGIYKKGYEEELGVPLEGVDSNIRHSEALSTAMLLSERNIDPNSDDVSLLLSPLLDAAKDKGCLLLEQGWWTVEFCYGQFIRQVHLEAKKEKNKKGQMVHTLKWDVKQEHVIGRWDAAKDITKENYMIHKNEMHPQRTYASMVYGGGDQCDLNKKPRWTEIQFKCGANKHQSELVKSREDPSCQYIAVVETPLLCGHPDFKIPTAPKREIVCYPFDETEFVKEASSMKQVADAEVEMDDILRMVTSAVQHKYQT
eukprot:266615_1